MTGLVQSLQRRLVQTLAAVVPKGPVALLNFPQHGNAGDPAIWLGTLAVLRELGCPVVYASNPSSYDEAALRAAVPEGAVLLNGGGNFGDLYGPQQQLREHVLATLRDRMLVQLPQSIYFSEIENEQRVRRLVDEHPNFTLCVREQRSQQRAEAFDCPVILAPDMVFGLGVLSRPQPECDILWLHRDEASPEAVPALAPVAAEDIAVAEWLGGLQRDQEAWPPALRHHLVLAREFAMPDAADLRRREWPQLAETFEPLAHAWVRRGTDMLGRGSVVVTDRLHGHLLSLLMEIPHVVMDNSYGKCLSTAECWTAKSPLVHTADSSVEALEIARSLLPGRSAASNPREAGSGC